MSNLEFIVFLRWLSESVEATIQKQIKSQKVRPSLAKLSRMNSCHYKQWSTERVSQSYISKKEAECFAIHIGEKN